MTGDMERENRILDEQLKDDANLRRLAVVVRDSNDAITVQDITGIILAWNLGAVRMYGYTEKEALGMNALELVPDESREENRKMLAILARGEPITSFETRRLTKDRRIMDVWLTVTVTSLPDDDIRVQTFSTTERDITERKRNEEKLHKVNRSMKMISECNNCLVRATDEKDFLKDACRIIRDNGDYYMVWVGMIDGAADNIVHPVAYAGIVPFDYECIKIDLADPDVCYTMLRSVIANGEFQKRQNLPNDCRPCFGPPWSADRSCRSILAMPLFFDNRTMGALTIYSALVDTFDNDETRLLLGLANDISYGISALQTGVKHKRSEEQVKINLKKIKSALDSTVMALTATSETRDPYTAGHQRRVTQLACAIAQEIGLPEDRINGIRVAGLLHDIGKINIPSEILTKPSKLSDIEFAIIKTHPKAAYDIIKSIDFPWPIAQYIIQHHEKLNGSGYPSGLKGDEILMESRILCVADIVEAMSSHRPYRPALGIEVALGDILANKGVLYDPVVVDSCVKLFRDKGFKFEQY